MLHLFLICMGIGQIIQTWILLDVSVLCIFHLMSAIRLLLKCAFLGYVSLQKGFAYHDPHARHARISRNVVFFDKQYFFLLMSINQLKLLSILPNFSEQPCLSTTIKY